MDFRQLEAYVNVIELNSFSKAAEAIFLSQPSISSYISTLEKELQTQLIYRSTKEVLPSKAGKLFYEYAKNMLILRDKSIFSIKNLTSSVSGEIDILASSVPSQYILPEILAAFHDLYPNISFQINQASTVEVIKGVSSQKFEFGFVGAMIENSKCRYEHFTSDELLIIAPNTPKYKDIGSPDPLEFFTNESFIMREKGSATRIKYEEVLKKMGIKLDKLNISASFTNTDSIIHAVSKGLGISIVSKMAAADYIEQNWIVTIDMDLPYIANDFYFVFKKDFMLSHISEIFIEFAKSFQENKSVH